MAIRHNNMEREVQLFSLHNLFIWLLLLSLLTLSSCAPDSDHKKTGTPTTNQTQTAQRTYVALGASDTFGLGTTDPYLSNWASDLRRKLGSTYRLINLGIPGILTRQALKVEVPIARDSHPDLITVWLAVNDLNANIAVKDYARDLDALLSRLQEGAPHAQIVIANVPDLTLLKFFYSKPHYDQQTLQNQITAYNKVIAEAVQKHHIRLVDLTQSDYDLTNHPEYVSGDGLHPTVLGYERLAELFYQVINR